MPFITYNAISSAQFVKYFPASPRQSLQSTRAAARDSSGFAKIAVSILVTAFYNNYLIEANPDEMR